MSETIGIRHKTVERSEQRHAAPFDRRLIPLYAIIGIAVAVLVGSVESGEFTYDPALLKFAIFVAMIAVIGYAARWVQFSAMAGIAEAVALLCAIAVLVPLCAAVLASSNRPLVDDFLLRLDAGLFFGFDRRVFAEEMSSLPVLMAAMKFAYRSLSFQPFLLVVALFLGKREDRAWTFVGAWFTTLLLTLAIFPFFPALGTPPYGMRWIATFEHLRSGELRYLGDDTLTGIITFPSFHAAAAVLLAWGFASFRGVGLPLVLLNALMFVSAIAEGGHYLVDLFAGGAVALVALKIAEPMIRNRAA